MLCLFPFEPEIYHKAHIPATYVGHPLADMLPDTAERRRRARAIQADRPAHVVALLPGSRQSELSNMAALFVDTAKLIYRQLKNVHFLVPLVSRETRRQFEEALYHGNAEDLPLTILVRTCAHGDDGCGRRAARLGHRCAGSGVAQAADGGHLQDAALVVR